MKSTRSIDPSAMTRRAVFRRATLVAGGAALTVAGLGAGLAGAAPAKVKQSSVSYQTTPKGRSRCEICAKWVAPNACQTVEGVISPTGWCNVFAPRM